MFCRESPTIQPLGFSQQATRLAAVHGGFLTWAAKPRVRKSLTPQKLLFNKDGQLLRWLLAFHYYESCSLKVSCGSIFLFTNHSSLDDEHTLPVAGTGG